MRNPKFGKPLISPKPVGQTRAKLILQKNAKKKRVNVGRNTGRRGRGGIQNWEGACVRSVPGDPWPQPMRREEGDSQHKQQRSRSILGEGDGCDAEDPFPGI